MPNPSSTPSGGSTTPTSTTTTPSSTTTTTPTTGSETARTGAETTRTAEVQSLNISQLNERLNGVEGDIAAKYNELIAIYEGTRANPPTIRLDSATQLQLETLVGNYADQMETTIDSITGTSVQDRARRQELVALQNHARNTVEVMMNARGAGFQEYMGLVGDNFMDKVNEALRNPTDFGKWMEIFASASVLMRYFGVMGKAEYRSRGARSQTETTNTPSTTTTETTTNTNESTPERPSLTRMPSPSLNDEGKIVCGGYIFDRFGNAKNAGGDTVALASLPANVKGVALFLQQRQGEINRLNGDHITAARNPRHHMMLSVMALRLQQMFDLQGDGLDSIAIMEGTIDKTLDLFIYGAEPTFAEHMKGALGLTMLTRMASSGVRKLWSETYGSEGDMETHALELAFDDIPRFIMYYREKTVESWNFQEMMTNYRNERSSRENLRSWDAISPTWSEGNSKIELGGGYSVDTTGVLYLGDNAVTNAQTTSENFPAGASQYKAIWEFASKSENQTKLAQLVSKLKQDDPGAAMPQLMYIAIRLQQKFASDGKTANAFQYLTDKWDADRGIRANYETTATETSNLIGAGIATFGLLAIPALIKTYQYASEVIANEGEENKIYLDKITDDMDEFMEYVNDNPPA